MRTILKAFNHFFVQDVASQKLLASIHYNNTTVAGDTRFDRVSKILEQDNSLDFITDFKNNQYTLVAGSTWEEDEKLLVQYINNVASESEKFIIAPHTISKSTVDRLKKSIQTSAILFSEKEGKKLSEFQVLIIDTIGLLTKIYAAADIAYVGGGFKTGLHNVLEPATFGIPVVIGNQYKKFKEAVDLVALKSVVAVTNQKEFTFALNKFKLNPKEREALGNINKKYIQEHIGATELIMNEIGKLL